MTNNDILRRLRYALNINDNTVKVCFNLAGYEIGSEELDSYFKREDDDNYKSLHDKKFEYFLDGLIIHHRGKQNRSEENKPRKKPTLNNNEIFKKLRIALKLKDTDIIHILSKADFRLSKSELGALFRPKGHKHYTKCGDQILRNFIHGLSIKN